MCDEVLEEFTRQYIEANPGPEVTFTWQGGEPVLLGLRFFERAVELQQQYKKPGQHVANTFQTNAVLLDDEWASFFAKHGFLIGVSVDGPDECHDAFRRNKGGARTLDKVIRGVNVLRRHGVEYNALCCVHRANVHRPLDVYRFMRDELAVSFIQFIPSCMPGARQSTWFSSGARKTVVGRWSPRVATSPVPVGAARSSSSATAAADPSIRA